MMKVPRASAISKLGIRLRERRGRASAGDHPALTETDDENIASFESLLSRAIDVLNLENQALIEGNVSDVSGYYQAKSDLLKSLELRQPVIEPFLREDIPEIRRLKELIGDLATQLTRNGQLLEGMAEASRSIISEVERVRRRQGLEGLYDKTGQLRENLGETGRKIEKNL
jgi:hypothetical protein